ncbi:hypothetical protein CMO91_03455 [Candidatus Woesearchaeota archaeon]|nr:hypothetical protein [Candidatus Woesearchaeota archaeon]
MDTLVFDAGPIISLTLNNILWVLKPLKERYKGSFILPDAVHKELVDRPLKGKKFKYEAFQVQSLVEQGVFDVVKDAEVISLGKKLSNLGNSCFQAKGNPLQIVQAGEMESIAYALHHDRTIVMDERITRMLVEEPEKLCKRLEKRFHFPVHTVKSNLSDFKDKVGKLDIIRSVELATVAFEQGLFNDVLIKIPNARKELLDSLLWGLKLNGCAVSNEEMKSMVRRVHG